MGDGPKQGSVEALLNSRQQVYGNAWYLTNQILKFIPWDRFDLILKAGFMFNWVMILNKLCRVLWDPNNKDHWRDMEGYARLVIDGTSDPDNIPSQ